MKKKIKDLTLENDKVLGKVEAFFSKIDESKSTFEIAKETILSLKRYEDSLEKELQRVRNQYIEIALIIAGKEELLNESN